MKRHLRIAADAGHSHAQYSCRLGFGREASVPNRVRLEQERRDKNEDKEGQRPLENHFERNEENSHKKRRHRASKKSDIGTC